MWLRLTAFSIALSLSTAAHAAKPYAESGFFQVSANCGGCPKGDKGIQLHPAVVEYLLATPESVSRAHYQMVRHWDLAGRPKTTTNPLIVSTIEDDVANVYAAQKPFIDEQTGATDLQGAVRSDEEGTVFARALARHTAAAANEMLDKKGWMQFMWGWRWENAGDAATPEFKTPTVFGTHVLLLVPSATDQNVSTHLFGQGMVTTVRKAVATYDLSGVPGAFDPAANLTYDQVAQTIQRVDGPIEVTFDPDFGFITGVAKR